MWPFLVIHTLNTSLSLPCCWINQSLLTSVLALLLLPVLSPACLPAPCLPATLPACLPAVLDRDSVHLLVSKTPHILSSDPQRVLASVTFLSKLLNLTNDKQLRGIITMAPRWGC
jgi:hypothetical protein